MFREESRSDLGLIKIHDNVIISVASQAAMEIEGIKAIGKSFKMGFLEIFDQKSLPSIKVTRDKNGDIIVQIPIIVKYGYNIPETANKVQENVQKALEKTTNLSIKDINIVVQRVEK